MDGGLQGARTVCVQKFVHVTVDATSGSLGISTHDSCGDAAAA